MRSYKKFISEKFRADVSQLPLKDCLKTNDINEAVSKWNELYTNTLNKHAPVRKIKIRSKPKPWFTQELQTLINNRDNTRKKAIATKSEIVWKQYQVEKKSVIKAVKDAKDSFFQKTLTECKNNPKQMWNCIKRLAPTKKQSNPLPPEWLNKDQANKLNTFFSEIGVMTQNKLQPNKRCFPFPLDIRSKFSFKTVKSPVVKNLLLNIPSNKATGADNIDIKSLKIVADIVSPSIASILNLSIASAQFPAIWKSSLITPVFKSGAKTAIANYRPVSVLPLLSKLMEKVVNSQVTHYLKDNDILTKFYSGFRKNHSTQTALISITDNILCNMDKGLITPTILMDLSKAFDTIDHPLMLQKLLRYGFDTHSMFWFNSYLQNRLQYVKVGNILSNAAKVSCGVPQGSVLGPTLFNLYINEIPAMLKKLSSNDSNIHGYADDLQLYSSCKAEKVEEMLSMLKDDIYLILEWFSANKLKANPDKFQFIIFGTNKQLAKIPPSCTKIDIQDNLVEAAKEVKILGMQIDQTLSWKSHISHLKKSCAGKLIQMKQIRNCMKRETFSNVVQACVLSSVQYGDIVYGNASKTALHKAQLIQNFAAKVVTGMHKFDHVTPALNTFQ